MHVSSLFCLLTETMDLFEETEDMLTFYLVFHLIGISSTCTNPILYGFLNDNFKKVWGINNIISTVKIVNLHWSRLHPKLSGNQHPLPMVAEQFQGRPGSSTKTILHYKSRDWNDGDEWDGPTLTYHIFWNKFQTFLLDIPKNCLRIWKIER